jgi:iron(III) transport system permease protein
MSDLTDAASGPWQPAPHEAKVRRPSHRPTLIGLGLVTAVVLLPVATMAGLAIFGNRDSWPHLLHYVLPGATLTTLHLLALVALMSAAIGVGTAWSVVTYDFPMRRILAWALVLPLAVPPYLAAYAFAEFLIFPGPVQSLVRFLFGFHTPRDYWFPDIRSTGGAAFVLALVLYPYVYMTSRLVFIMQGRNIADVARTLGARPSRVFWRVLLPVARPAIVAGLALVLMESMNDIGAVEYLGVRTLTFSVFSTWLNRSSLEGAAQTALVMLALVFALLLFEQWARRNQRFHAARSTQLAHRPPRMPLTGFVRYALPLVLCLPILLGFGIPLYIFGTYASRRLYQLSDPALYDALFNSILTASTTALITVMVALFLINAARLSRSPAIGVLTRFAMIGYAVPGTILSLGLLFSLATIDNSIDTLARSWLDRSTGLLLTGSIAGVVLACSIRFLALAEGALRSGLAKLPPHLDEAARSLGRSPSASAAAVLLPLMRPAILTAAVLVFVDTIKELSATILLRPFGFNTLATYVYENASRAVVQEGATAALFIIVVAMVPVVLLSGALARDQDAHI